MTLTKECAPGALDWSLPQGLELAPEELSVRLDFYHSTVVMHVVEKDRVTSRMVSARDIALALLKEMPLMSGILPPDTLWWSQYDIGLWISPRVWPVALMMEAFKEPRRLKIPMPGLIFVCRAGHPPQVVAAKRRPASMKTLVYHAPLFNVYQNGTTCPGTHRYPHKLEEIPRSFFLSFFTVAAQHGGRSKKYPHDLLKLWEELDGQTKYPMDDLVPMGKLGEVLGKHTDIPTLEDLNDAEEPEGGGDTEE